MALSRLIARPLLASYFLANGALDLKDAPKVAAEGAGGPRCSSEQALNAEAKGLASACFTAGVPPWREAFPGEGPPKEQTRHRPRESLR